MLKSANLLYKTIQIEKKKTVAELLKELNLDNNFFAVLINGKRADTNQFILPEDKIIILPQIKGGQTSLIQI